MTITAIDEANNTYDKQVSLDVIDDIVCIVIDNAVWRFEDIIKLPKNHSMNPISNNRFYLDISGRNHSGYPVWCSSNELLKLTTGVQHEN